MNIEMQAKHVHYFLFLYQPVCIVAYEKKHTGAIATMMDKTCED